MTSSADDRAPVALVTGVGRSIGIGAAVAKRLTNDGWRVVTTGWRPYDERMSWGADDETIGVIEADLADPGRVPSQLLDGINETARDGVGSRALSLRSRGRLEASSTGNGPWTASTAISPSTVGATWLLIKSFAEQFSGPTGPAGSSH